MGSPEDEWRWAVDSLKECQDHAEKQGVRLGLEPLNRFETYFLNRCDQALALAEDVGGDCGVCLDIFHMNIEEADWPAAIRTAGDKLVDFHVADNNRMPPGQGAIDWELLVRTLEDDRLRRLSHGRVRRHGRPQPHLAAAGDRGRVGSGRERRARAVPARSRDGRRSRAALRRVRPGVDRHTAPAHRRSADRASLGGTAVELRSYNIADLAPPDIQGYLEEKDIVMVPIASMEQHGPHLPLATDTIQADEITRRAAERAQVLYTPCVWFGYSPQHMYEPGRAARGRSRCDRRSCSRSTTTSLARSSTTASIDWCSSTTTGRTSRSSTRSYAVSATRPVRSSPSPSCTRSATSGLVSDVMENPPEETPGWHSSELETAQVLAHDERAGPYGPRGQPAGQEARLVPGFVHQAGRSAGGGVPGLPVLPLPDGSLRTSRRAASSATRSARRREKGERTYELYAEHLAAALEEFQKVPGRGAHAGMAGPSVTTEP